MSTHLRFWTAAMFAVGAAIVVGCSDSPTALGAFDDLDGSQLDRELRRQLDVRQFTGRIEETLEARLGRPIDDRLADIGRLLFFDPILSLTQDNSCSGCHGPNVAFNDAVSISIGVGNNGVVGEGRGGPHNLRRAPTLLNSAFYPRLMWDIRFSSDNLDPFDNQAGFTFPPPDGASLSFMEHLLSAQAFTPVVSREEMAGFGYQGTAEEMRAEVASRVDAIAGYRSLFGEVVPEIAQGGAIGYRHIGAALGEFMLTLVRADAPLDRYARGDTSALTPDQKRGALLFYRPRAACFECHIGEGYANEMFSDFDAHVLAVPQVRPLDTNATFDGPGEDEDYGFERVTGEARDRYKFRTSPLRNVGYQPTFMHNGAFVCLEEAIRHHTDVYRSLEGYSNDRLASSLQGQPGPVQPMLDRVHPISKETRDLTEREVEQIVDFVRVGLSDPDAHPARLAHLIPSAVPSGLPVHFFDFSERAADCF